jgi:cell division control protein 24
MCHLFRLGSPLCHLYNLLLPAFTDPTSGVYADYPAPRQIEYDFPSFLDSPDGQGLRNWAKRPENAKTCQKYIAVFCMAMKQRYEEGRWHGESWALHELWGKTSGDDIEAYDSTGLMKVLQTVETMIENLPESAIVETSPTTPHMSHSSHHGHLVRPSYDMPFSLGGNASGAAAVASMAATMNGGVHIDAEATPEDMQRTNSSADANAFKSVEELVSSEKSYVQELEILVRCSQEMVDAQLISTDRCHQIFSNLSKILDFHRKFLIKLETEYEPIEEGQGARAWAVGRWGLPFVTSESEFNCYGPYCANYLDAMQTVTEQMPNLLVSTVDWALTHSLARTRTGTSR